MNVFHYIHHFLGCFYMLNAAATRFFVPSRSFGMLHASIVVYNLFEYVSVFMSDDDIQAILCSDFTGKNENELIPFSSRLLAENNKNVVVYQNCLYKKNCELEKNQQLPLFLKFNSIMFAYKESTGEKKFKITVHNSISEDSICFVFVAERSFEFFIYRVNLIDRAKNFEVSIKKRTKSEAPTKFILKLTLGFKQSIGLTGYKIFDQDCFVTSGLRIFRLHKKNLAFLKRKFELKFKESK